MRILLINQFYYPFGGTELSVKSTNDLLTQKGHEVIVFSTKDERNFDFRYQEYFLSKIDYDSSKLIKRISALKRILIPSESRIALRKLLKEQGPIDVAHINLLYFQISPSIIFELKRFNIPIVMTIRNFFIFCASGECLYRGEICDECRGFTFYKAIFKKCCGNSVLRTIFNTLVRYWYYSILKVLNKIDIFIATSSFLKSKMLAMGLDAEIIHLPNFIFTKYTTPNYSWQEKSIVYFGRIIEYKGLKTLIKAVENLDIQLKIIGKGPLEDSIRDKIKSSNLKNIQLLGFLDKNELYDEIKKSMFVVVPSEWWEPFGRSIIESYALGKPVIASAIGGIEELVKEGVTGMLFQAKDSNQLKMKIEYLINNPDLIVKMGQNARKLVEEIYDAESHYKNLMNIYSSAIKKNKYKEQ